MEDHTTTLSAASVGSRQYYEELHIGDYMLDWLPTKQQRIRDFLASLSLPAEGRFLDYGCGKGSLTPLLHEVLPGWEGFGTDVSETAMSFARGRHPQCEFISLDQAIACPQSYDLVFSHHVLEHVSDLAAAISDQTYVLNDGGLIVAIMPCGNKGSVDQKIASLVRDGIDPATGKLFYEEPAHLRRLTSDALQDAMANSGLALESIWFSNHFYGSIDYLSTYGFGFIRRMTPLKRAESLRAAARLLQYRSAFLPFAYAWAVCSVWKRGKTGFPLPLKSRIRGTVARLLYPAGWALRSCIERLSAREWRRKRREPGASEMFTAFSRNMPAQHPSAHLPATPLDRASAGTGLRESDQRNTYAP